MATLHYFHDPLCGWCYGAAPLLEAATRVDGLKVNLLGGGLWPRPTTMPASMRTQIRAADARIGQMTGQPFGKGYLEGWLKDESTIVDSRPTTAAWLAAQSVSPDLGLRMLQGIQRAHYVEGRRVVEPDVLTSIAESIGISAADFNAALKAVDVDAHIESTRRTMSRLGVGGFPTAFLELNGQLQPVALQSFFGQPEEFAKALAQSVRGAHVH
jgi:putative protein-disulfide isomerase